MSDSQRLRVTFVGCSAATLNALEPLKLDAAFGMHFAAVPDLPSDVSPTDWIALTDQTSSDRLRAMIATAHERLVGNTESSIVVHATKAVPQVFWKRVPANLQPLLRPILLSDLRLYRASDTVRTREQLSQQRPQLSLECDADVDFASLPEVGPKRLSPISCSGIEIQNAVSSLKLGSMDSRCVESGVLLLQDDLDGSHSISQTMEGRGNPRTADYWHGIMHRREPDAGNASYWFRRVGHHPAMDELGTNLIDWMTEVGCTAAQLELASRSLVKNQIWDPFEMIRLSTIALRSKGAIEEQTCRVVQYLEMLNLLAWSASS